MMQGIFSFNWQTDRLHHSIFIGKVYQPADMAKHLMVDSGGGEEVRGVRQTGKKGLSRRVEMVGAGFAAA